MTIQRAMAFDFGLKRIGVAVGQTITGTANPLTTLDAVNGEPDWCNIEKLLQEWNPNIFILGMPGTENGQPHPMTKKINRFKTTLEQKFKLPVELVNETLSSIEAEQGLSVQDKMQKKAVDARAAAVILESWFRLQETGIT